MPENTRKKQRRKIINPAGRAWVTARKVTQYVLLVAFILLFFMSRRDAGWPGNLVNIPFRLDPLTVLANLISSRTFLAGSALALLTLLLTLVFGRAWCGWICPLGTTLDLFPLKRLRGKRRPPAEGWRKIKSVLLFATLTAALLGNLSLLVFDPLTILFRTLTTAIWPGVDRGIMALETLLFRVPFLSEPVAAFDSFIRPAILPLTPIVFRDALLFGLLFLAIIALNIFAERFWCRYLCPLGGLLGWISKIAIFRRAVGEECTGCVLCTEKCPTGTIDPSKNYASDPAECTMCLDCLETCPRSKISFTPGLLKPEWQPYDPARREFLATIGVSVAAVALTRVGMLTGSEHPFLIHPPGMREVNPDILSVTKCIRCSECMRACPTQAIQTGIFEGGLQGFAVPVIVPRLGYCDFSCNACGQVCPTQAIPPLSLEEKQRRVIGKAYIDKTRCLPWAEDTECFVCEEMCPLPGKAIELRGRGNGGGAGQGTHAGGGNGSGAGQGQEAGNGSGEVQVPHVISDLCIGCGICENKCPVSSEAAIRVYAPGEMNL
jgi:polyferredoxin